MPRLSVLDFVPLRTDQTSADAVAASRQLAQAADALGYHRYWVSEHHASPFASTNPLTLVGVLGASTSRIRVGTGGVMLPNHTPLDVAEQAALLEAAFPGRIDLGLGRAPGGDTTAVAALRGGSAATAFPEEVAQVTAMMRPGGAAVRTLGHTAALTATPAAASMPDVWLLGSSPHSAVIAAEAGMPYVYAHHFFGTGAADAVATYRDRFVPSAQTPSPRLILTMNAVVADTVAEAQRLALPYLHTMLSLQTGAGLQPQLLVDDAEAVGIPRMLEATAATIVAPWVIGTGAQARTRITAFAEQYDVDEIMIHPVGGAFAGTAAGTSPERERTLQLLAAA